MFAPVVFRFLSYGIKQPQATAHHLKTVLQDHDIKEWVKDAKAEQEVLE